MPDNFSPLVKRSAEILDPPEPLGGGELSGGSEGDESMALLPKHTVVRVVGNARTKAAFVGQRAVVKRAVGLGGWHWLVLSTGEEIKLQRNALVVLEYPTGNEMDFSDEEDEEEQRRLAAATAARQMQSPSYSESLADKPRQRRPPQPVIEDAGVRRMVRSMGQPRCNLGKLDTAALHRYRQFYKLSEAGPNPTKDELVHEVEEHFSLQEVDEAEVISCFLRAAKRQCMGLLHSL